MNKTTNGRISNSGPDLLVTRFAETGTIVNAVDKFMLQPGRLCYKLVSGESKCRGAIYQKANTTSDTGLEFSWTGSLSLAHLYDDEDMNTTELASIPCSNCFSTFIKTYGSVQPKIRTYGITYRYEEFLNLPYTCVIDSGDTIGCRGWSGGTILNVSNKGRLGVNGSSGWNSGFRRIETNSAAGNGKAKQVALGTNHGCMLTKDGFVSCWGANLKGQLGTGNNLESGEAIPVNFENALDR